MSVKDFPARPVGAAVDSPEYAAWVDRMAQRQNIDDLIAMTDPAGGDELPIFDASANALRKITLAELGAGSLFAQTATVTVANTTDETTLVGAGHGTVTLPASYFAVGGSISIRASGYYSTKNPAGTLRVKVKLGTTVILDTGAQTATNSITDLQWRISSVDITCRTIGTTGTVMAQGNIMYATAHTTATVDDFAPNKTAIEVNTTIAQALSITVQWGTAHASNSISCTNLLVTAR